MNQDKITNLRQFYKEHLNKIMNFWLNSDLIDKENDRSPRVPRDRVRSVEELQEYKTKNYSEYIKAICASKNRDLLVTRYGDKGKAVLFAEAVQASEYGKRLDENNIKEQFPF